MVRVHIPKIADIPTALRVFYTYPELNNAEIKELFPSACSTTIAKLKKKAFERMREKGVLAWGTYSVNTKAAFEAWGLDAEDLKERYEMLKSFDFTADKKVSRNGKKKG